MCKELEGISTTASNTVLPNSALSDISSGHPYSALVNNVGSGLWSGPECETGHAHHPGSSTQDFPDFSLDLTPPMDEYFTGQQYESYNSVTNESLVMHMFQNATPLISLWNELQVTGMSARSPPNFQSTPLEMQVGIHGKRQVDSLSGDEGGYSLFGDPGFGGLANPLTPNKRVRTSADGTSGNQEMV
ncbi:hypothetical protein N7488_007411 [Penicillium malachiteum]|nr:hypothetical protein N7488_007411 [Penicillium malachiteum]